VDAVSKLNQELDAEIVVPASFQLVRTLMELDVVDEPRLKIFPVVLGDGERLFGATRDTRPMRLVGAQSVEGDILHLTYELVHDAQLPSRAVGRPGAKSSLEIVQPGVVSRGLRRDVMRSNLSQAESTDGIGTRCRGRTGP
jgi:RibD C-terminal domain